MPTSRKHPMPANTLRILTMDEVSRHAEPHATDWLWHGYLMPGNHAPDQPVEDWQNDPADRVAAAPRRGRRVPGLDARPVKAWIVSEESLAQWRNARRLVPMGPHVKLARRPFRGGPARRMGPAARRSPRHDREGGGLDLFVIDPLASFLPGRCESDAGTLLESLQPLHRLASAGVAVLLLHHPRKKASEPGHAARGSGRLARVRGHRFELKRFGKLSQDDAAARSWRSRASPKRRAAWPTNGTRGPTSSAVADPHSRNTRRTGSRCWRSSGANEAVTHEELGRYGPSNSEKPARRAVPVVNQAFAKKLVRSEGKGTKRTRGGIDCRTDDEYWIAANCRRWNRCARSECRSITGAAVNSGMNPGAVSVFDYRHTHCSHHQ